MVKIDFHYEQGSETISLLISGHAGQSAYGSDIVCSSVSILTYTLVIGLSKAEEQGKLKLLSYSLEEGNAEIMCVYKPNYRKEIDLIFDLITSGLRSISYNYPQYVEYNEC